MTPVQPVGPRTPVEKAGTDLPERRAPDSSPFRSARQPASVVEFSERARLRFGAGAADRRSAGRRVQDGDDAQREAAALAHTLRRHAAVAGAAQGASSPDRVQGLVAG